RDEKFVARTRQPRSGLRRRRIRRYVPGGQESAEMIQTNQVNVVEQRTQTSDPPTVAGLTKSLPVVKRIAPKLSRHTEIIRRHTGNDTRAAIFVQQKQLVVGPHVAGVSGNKKGQVADQSHAFFVGVSLHPVGLAEQQELRKGSFADLIGKLTAKAAERRRLALH